MSESATTRRQTSPDRESPSTTVVRTVADRENCEPTDLRPLYQAIDPDALDTVANDATDNEIRVEFTYHGYEIVVDDHVHVTEQ